MGETRVDLLHLLEDLRDAYPASLEETIVGEIVANALDSGATMIALEATPDALIVRDNGSGMTRAELRRYHDLAASAKTRGRTIGFAGVGIKLGLLACDDVFTETGRGTSRIATTWRLASRHRAPWIWASPAGLMIERGTAVRLRPQTCYHRCSIPHSSAPRSPATTSHCWTRPSPQPSPRATQMESNCWSTDRVLLSPSPRSPRKPLSPRA